MENVDSLGKEVGKKYELEDDDYLRLWEYFQDKAVNVKGAMFNTITWIVGFAAALLAFIFSKVTNYETLKAVVPLSTLMIVVSVAGLAICQYAFFALRESAKHIKSNWDRADECLKVIKGLGEIISPNEIKKKKKSYIKKKANKKINKKNEIWDQLGIVIKFFVIAFAIILIWGVVASMYQLY
jgi:Co/Zn/Cd efflux system component